MRPMLIKMGRFITTSLLDGSVRTLDRSSFVCLLACLTVCLFFPQQLEKLGVQESFGWFGAAAEPWKKRFWFPKVPRKGSTLKRFQVPQGFKIKVLNKGIKVQII